eukprot:jgi/Tetstr1/464617/TSEL_009371.t1
MGRQEAWKKIVSYEACMQVCLHTLMDSNSSASHLLFCRGFLHDRCAALRSAFQLHGLLLQPVPGSEASSPLCWDDTEGVPAGFSHGMAGSETLRLEVADIRLQSAKGLKWLGGKLSAPVPGGRTTALLYPGARPAARAEWPESVVAGGREAQLPVSDCAGAPARHLEVLPGDAERGGKLELRLQAGDSTAEIARASVTIQDIWQAGQGAEVGREGRAEDGGSGGGCGERWVYMKDPQGQKIGKLLLRFWTHRRPMAVAPGRSSPEGGQRASATMQIAPQQVYTATLQAACASSACGPRRLEVAAEWEWLLGRIASLHALRRPTTLLAHLEWVLRPENATPRSDCLRLLAWQLEPLLRASAAGELPETEVTSLQRLRSEADALLGRTLERYRCLSDDVESGVLEPGDTAPQVPPPPPALAPAMRLFRLVRDPLDPGDQRWLLARLAAAARSRYQRLEADILASAEAEAAGAGKAVDGEVMYGAMERVCTAVLRELGIELALHRTDVMPSFANVASTAAAEHCAALTARLGSVLADYPPRDPSPAVIKLTQAAGRLQAFLQAQQLGGPGAAAGEGGFDAEGIFGAHVRQWVASSTAFLKERCRQLEREGGAGVGMAATPVAPCAAVVADMQRMIEAECRKYEALALMQPALGMHLEGMCVSVLREVLDALLRGDGSSGAPTTANLGKKLKGFLGGSGRGRRSGVGGGVRAPPAAVADIPGRGSASRGGRSCGPPYAPSATETVLLNSMRRLLVWLPQLEEMLVKWCGGYRSAAASGVGSLRQRGLAASRAGEDNFPARFCGQFQHLMSTLRSVNGEEMRSAAKRLAHEVEGAAPDCLKEALTCSPAVDCPEAGDPGPGDRLAPLLHSADAALTRLRGEVDERVLVELTRGLWHHTGSRLCAAKEQLECTAKTQQESCGVHVNAGALLEAINHFFRGFLNGCSNLKEGDLNMPKNVEAAHFKLRWKGTDQVDKSFSQF